MDSQQTSPPLPPINTTPTRGPAAPLPDSTFIPPVANRRNIRALPARMVVIHVGCLLALVVGVGLLMLSRANDPADDINKLQAMMQSLSDITAEGRKYSKNPDVVKLTSDASILINGDTTTLKTVLSTTGIKENKAITTAEKTANAVVLSELKSAATDARFDRAYVSALSAKLKATQAQLSQVYDKTSKPSIRATTTTVYDHFATLIESLDKLNL